MKIKDPGHLYEVENLGESTVQEISFIKKELDPDKTDGSLRTVVSGTTNEEVLKVIIDRIQILNGKFPCRENSIVITKLQEALMWLEKRTADRVVRGVEGKQTA